jgi:hypothetical protein
MAKIGHTFGEEVAAALGDVPISWTPDGDFYGRENLTDTQNATLDSVIIAHDPMASETKNKAYLDQRKLHAETAAVQNLVDQLQTMTPDQINSWIDGCSMQELQAVVANILKLLAARLPPAQPSPYPPLAS